jgi:hypothetical protein
MKRSLCRFNDVHRRVRHRHRRDSLRRGCWRFARSSRCSHRQRRWRIADWSGRRTTTGRGATLRRGIAPALNRRLRSPDAARAWKPGRRLRRVPVGRRRRAMASNYEWVAARVLRPRRRRQWRASSRVELKIHPSRALHAIASWLELRKRACGSGRAAIFAESVLSRYWRRDCRIGADQADQADQAGLRCGQRPHRCPRHRPPRHIRHASHSYCQ